MNALPLLPKTKSAWIACLFLIVVLFWCYYKFLYPSLLENYKQQTHVIPYTAKQNTSPTKDLEINLIIPKSLGADTIQYATISLHNLKQESIDLNLRLVWAKAEDISSDLAVITLVGTIEPEEVSVHVQPNSYEFVRLPLIFVGDSIKLDRELLISVKVLTSQGGFISETLSPERANNIVVNRIESSWDSILKELLLPPLANVVLAGLIITLCWFFEDSEEEDKPIKWAKVLAVWGQSALWAFLLILLFYFTEVGDNVSVVLEIMFLVVYMAICIYISQNPHMLLKTKKDIKSIRDAFCGRLKRLFNRGGQA